MNYLNSFNLRIESLIIRSIERISMVIPLAISFNLRIESLIIRSHWQVHNPQDTIRFQSQN